MARKELFYSSHFYFSHPVVNYLGVGVVESKTRGAETTSEKKMFQFSGFFLAGMLYFPTSCGGYQFLFGEIISALNNQKRNFKNSCPFFVMLVKWAQNWISWMDSAFFDVFLCFLFMKIPNNLTLISFNFLGYVYSMCLSLTLVEGTI